MQTSKRSKIFALAAIVGISLAVLYLVAVINIVINSGATFLLVPIAVIVVTEIVSAALKTVHGDRNAK